MAFSNKAVDTSAGERLEALGGIVPLAVRSMVTVQLLHLTICEQQTTVDKFEGAGRNRVFMTRSMVDVRPFLYSWNGAEMSSICHVGILLSPMNGAPQ